jgi:hypothetical protein
MASSSTRMESGRSGIPSSFNVPVNRYVPGGTTMIGQSTEDLALRRALRYVSPFCPPVNRPGDDIGRMSGRVCQFASLVTSRVEPSDW